MSVEMVEESQQVLIIVPVVHDAVLVGLVVVSTANLLVHENFGAFGKFVTLLRH